MGSREFSEWLGYFRHDPFGNERVDMGFAQVAQALYNVNRDIKTHPTPFPLSDFLLRFAKETEDEARNRILAAVAAFGGGLPDDEDIDG